MSQPNDLSRCLVSLESAERLLQQVVGEQRVEVVEHLFGLLFRSLGDAIEPLVHRASAAVYGRCSVSFA